MMLVLFAVCYIVARASADPGKCPDAQSMDNFNFDLYGQGRWFELARYDQLGAESGADCVFFDYARQGDDVHCILREIVAKKEQTFDLIVKFAPDTRTKGKLVYSTIRNRKMENVNVYILDTDYKNYSIFYYCSYDETKKANTELAWIKSRTPNFSPEVKAVVDKFIETHPLLDPKKFKWDSFTHADCLIDV